MKPLSPLLTANEPGSLVKLIDCIFDSVGISNPYFLNIFSISFESLIDSSILILYLT